MHLRIIKSRNSLDTEYVLPSYEPKTDERSKRLAMIGQWCKRPEFGAFKDNKEFAQDIINLASYVEIEDLEYAPYPCLNHWLLNEEERRQREAIVETEIENLFGANVQARDADTVPMLGAVRSCMKVVPTPLLQQGAALACWFANIRLWSSMMFQRKGLKHDDSFKSKDQELLKRLINSYPWANEWIQLKFAVEMSSGDRTLIIGMLNNVGRGIAIHRHPEFIAIAKRLSGHPAGVRVLAAVADVYIRTHPENSGKDFPPHPDSYFMPLLSDLETASQKRPELSAKEIKWTIDKGLRQLEQVTSAQRQEAEAQTLQLMLEGKLVLGPTYGPEAAQALEYLYKIRVESAWNARRAFSPSSQTSSSGPIANTGRGRGRQPGGRTATRGRGSAASNTVTSIASNDDAKARENWRVEQYVEWIEGRTATDAAQAAAKYNEQLKKRREAQSNALAKLAPGRPALLLQEEAPEMTEAEADEIIQAGLRKTVEYISDEVDDVKTLAQLPTVHVDLAPLTACAEKLKDLKAQKRLGEVEARKVFEEVWTQLELIRSTIVEQQHSEQVYRDFETALWKALKDEGLQVGKTTGGNVVLGAPDPLAYWPRIAKDYHNRYLTVASDSVGANAQDSDHAFAFYVTLGSRTQGVAFCISVHRWQRKAETSEPACNVESQKINENWRDTLVPYLVLHVRGTPASKAH